LTGTAVCFPQMPGHVQFHLDKTTFVDRNVTHNQHNTTDRADLQSSFAMAYVAVAGEEHEAHRRDSLSVPSSPLQAQSFESPLGKPLRPDFNDMDSPVLFMDQQHEDGSLSTGGLSNTIQSVFSRTRSTSYDQLDGDDYLGSNCTSPVFSAGSRSARCDDLIPRRQRCNTDRNNLTPSSAFSPTDEEHSRGHSLSRSSSPPQLPLRTASRKGKLRHPTPDLQTLQGAYMSNVQRLERSAEELSMTSSIDDAIKKLHDEQKQLDHSRRSSLLALSVDVPGIIRQFSNASSIVDVNNAARSGGYSPGGFNIPTLKDHFPQTGTRGRSASKSSNVDARPEPELEGRPLASFVGRSLPPSRDGLPIQENKAGEASNILKNEVVGATTITGPALGSFTSFEPTPFSGAPQYINQERKSTDRPDTSASTTTFDQAQRMFQDFDGQHYTPEPEELLDISPPGASGETDRRQARMSTLSLANMAPRERPKTYVDPGNGQKMVYYPAPVPMVIQLPQRLSKVPPSAIKDKRRTQVMSTIPPIARQSAPWLTDLQEVEHEQEEVIDRCQQRKSAANLPAQLRASTFFDAPGPPQTLEIKGKSAVNTLESLLDASVYAPVNAYTDHPFSGPVGNEVYGRTNVRASRNIQSNSRPNSSDGPKKRSSTFNLLPGKRNTSYEDDEIETLNRRRNTLSGILGFNKSQDKDQTSLMEDNDQKDHEEHEDTAEEDFRGIESNNMYIGAPTTLLAELQIRKQEQKSRTRALSSYPNGMHSTLLEMDAVAQVQKKSRGQKRVTLAWEDKFEDEVQADEDEDVPLGVLFPAAQKARTQNDQNRPMGLIERRELEDNEPLARRRERLLGIPRAQPQNQRASTMLNFRTGVLDEDENETLAQRKARLQALGRTSTGLPATRPVSGAFTSELLGQFGGDENQKPPDEEDDDEEETLAQRRRRLLAEKEARKLVEATGIPSNEAPEATRPALKTSTSMGDLLAANPIGAQRQSSYGGTERGLLGMHEKQSMNRSSILLGYNADQTKGKGQQHRTSTMMGQNQAQREPIRSSTYPIKPTSQVYSNPQYIANTSQMQFPLGSNNPYAAYGGMMGQDVGFGGYMNNPMATNFLQLQARLQQNGAQMTQAQMDFVERWRSNVAYP
jgi:hypothetical protein